MRRRSLLGQKKPSNNADAVLAATAGADNWKTWAGRSHGTEEFEYLDIFRGMRRSLHHRFLVATPPPGATCPVCFCEPDEWHVTSSCSHFVCVDCLQAYASNQVRDKEQHGALKCPVCPQALRKSDAIVALGGDKKLIRLWDVKIRNQLLRALPAYRSCPKCSNRHDLDSDNDNMGGGGGGFVTPECLSPHYEERRLKSTNILYAVDGTVFVFFFIYVIMVTYIGKTPSRSAAVDLFFMFAPILPLLKLGRASQAWIADVARQEFFRPITVECPCCDQSFILPPELEANHLEDEETSRWLKSNTRPCPSCSVPINKNGGCNHIRCSHCLASFCWACMKLRTNCAAYNCKHGAPYRNAVPNPVEGLMQAQRVPNDSILTTIDYLLNRSRPSIRPIDGLVLGIALFGRNTGLIQLTVGSVVQSTVALIVGILTTRFVSLLVLFFSLFHLFREFRAFLNRHLRRYTRVDHRSGHITASELLLGVEERNTRDRERNIVRLSEQELIAEALRRSLRDQ